MVWTVSVLGKFDCFVCYLGEGYDQGVGKVKQNHFVNMEEVYLCKEDRAQNEWALEGDAFI